MSDLDDVTLDLAPSPMTTGQTDLPRASLARFSSQSMTTPRAWEPLLPEGVSAEADLRAWRIGRAVFALWDQFYVLVGPPGAAFVPLPLEEESAERLIRSLKDEEDPALIAFAVSAALELNVVLTEDELLAASDDTRVHERWRAPARDGDSVVFVAATRPRATGNELLELDVDVENGWVDATPLGAGWRTMPAFGVHSAPPPPRHPRPEAPPTASPGWLERLLRFTRR